LQTLWKERVDTYDVHENQTFKMKVALMWTINDFPAYGMLSGWSTHGALSCPVRQDQVRGSYLQHGRKMSWFDCHRCFLPQHHIFGRNKSSFTKNRTVHGQPQQRVLADVEFEHVREFLKVTDQSDYQILGFTENVHNWTKRSIFWDLPHWTHQVLHHNLDVMHIEKNFCENIINTVMDVSGKTKDNVKAWLDLDELCARDELHLRTREMATHTNRKKSARCPWSRGGHCVSRCVG